MTRGRAAAGAVTATLVLVASSIGGPVGLGYLLVYAAATVPGWPIGFALFGKRHPAAWISGGLIGYGITALALWVPIAARHPSPLLFVAAWGAAAIASWGLLSSRREPAVDLPRWNERATVSLCAVVLLVPLLVARPYGRIGSSDAEGNKRYRAYFTADFVWHEALTAELARFSSPPRNPYLAGRSLHYYWAYFLLPAVVTGAGPAHAQSPPIETYLAINALCTGVLFISVIFLAAWSAMPRPVTAAAATGLALLAASAEGLYAAVDLLRRGHPLAELRMLNIDAITSWYFQGLTIDGLPRSIWYNPQHSLACALGLVALNISGRASVPMRTAASATAGLALGLALIMSPFPGGAMTLIYALVVIWGVAGTPRRLPGVIMGQGPAVSLVIAALAWCVLNRTFEGAGSAIAIGLSQRARTSPALVLGLALGPVLIPVVAGCVLAAFERFPPESTPRGRRAGHRAGALVLRHPVARAYLDRLARGADPPGHLRRRHRVRDRQGA